MHRPFALFTMTAFACAGAPGAPGEDDTEGEGEEAEAESESEAEAESESRCPEDCDDGDACTGDFFDGCACGHKDVDCSDDNPCVTASCDPQIGCVFTAIDADCNEDRFACREGVAAECDCCDGVDNDSDGSMDAADEDCAGDFWCAITDENAPSARSEHVAVWAGQEMLVWGGWSGTGRLASGGRYNPETDHWIPIGEENAPEARTGASAVWTGSEMIIWGGRNFRGWLPTGGRYNPESDSWELLPDANAPEARTEYSAVWTGQEMIIWGGISRNSGTGARYNPDSDAWTTMARGPWSDRYHTAVWTGEEMLVWFGRYTFTATEEGHRYDPAENEWDDRVSNEGGPNRARNYSAVWDGTAMIIWGGTMWVDEITVPTETGARYHSRMDRWITISTVDAPVAPEGFAPIALLGDGEVFFWMGDRGARYDFNADAWRMMNPFNQPSGGTAVWTGSEMIVWGGRDESEPLASGARYVP